MKRVVFLAACVIALILPLRAMADSWAEAGVHLQLTGPYTTKLTRDYDSGRPPTFGLTAPDAFTWTDLPPGQGVGCSPPMQCYNMYAYGRAQADLSQGTLKTVAQSSVAYNYAGTSASANTYPNQADVFAELRDNLTVTIPAGVGATYNLGIAYDVSGTMSGTPQNGSNYGQAWIRYTGGLWAQGYGPGEGTGAGFNWNQSTMSASPTPFSTSGTAGMVLTGEASATTISVLLTIDLYGTANVFGILPAQAASDFGSTAHAGLTYDPGLVVTADSPFPGLTPVPGPAPFLLLSGGLAGIAALRRRLRDR